MICNQCITVCKDILDRTDRIESLFKVKTFARFVAEFRATSKH